MFLSSSVVDPRASCCVVGKGMLTATTPLIPKALAAKKTHKEAERRRRSRINTHLATLRALFPNLIKTDKASVLCEVVRRIRELKQASSETGLTHRTITSAVPPPNVIPTPNPDGHVSSDGENKKYKHTSSSLTSETELIPSDTDEVRLLSRPHPADTNDNDGTATISAAFCCEDRRDLIPDLTLALQNVKGKLVKAEMATVGGRIKCVLWVKKEAGVGGRGGGGGAEDIGKALSKALKVVVDKRVGGGSSGPTGLLGTKNKRQQQDLYR